jgi:hypothetical protein
MKQFLCSTLAVLLIHYSFAQLPETRFERSKGTETSSYSEIIAAWKQLDRLSPYVFLKQMGPTDAGFPLHLALISSDGSFNPASWQAKQKVVLLINNGIHPGEPDGIDASLLLVKDIVRGKLQLPSHVVLAIIPVYNIGGCLNQSPFYRIDQNGPTEKGSRGNSQNLDLNRDFIKSDAKESRSFAEIFHWTQPDIFIDNHVSNGADYQHVMTLLTTQHNKLGGAMGTYLNQTMEPALYQLMKTKGYDLIPYVNNFSEKPENGWNAYWDSPRYSSGYAALFNCFSFVPETHMLKPYVQRVDATFKLIQSFIEFAAANAVMIKKTRQEQIRNEVKQSQFPIGFTLDKTKSSEFTFHGYEAGRKPSGVSGLPRLYYDRNKPFTKQVAFYNFFTPKNLVDKPKAYILPQGWWKIVTLLQNNRVQMRPLLKDTVIEVEVYRIDEYKSSPRPWEGHHINTDVKTSKTVQKMAFRKGDWYIPMNQPANKFLMNVLEPTGEDSYFAWNFFDPILGQKEGYSGYVFEDIAEEFLKQNPAVREKLEQRRATDSSFAKSAGAQLNFVYQQSPYNEPGLLRYPVYRVR